MKKLNKILISLGSIVSISALPLVAASCKKTKKQEDTNNSSSNSSSNTENSNETMNNGDSGSHNIQGDDSNATTPNGGTYKVEVDSAEEKRKLEEEKARDLKDIEVVKGIIEEHKDAFGSFHNQSEFLDQINLYANEKGIKDLKLEDDMDKTKNLEVDTEGGKNNKIKLQLRSKKFDVTLGKVLKDRVITKYYIFGNDKNILTNDGNTWSAQNKKSNEKIVITQLGYFYNEQQGNNKYITLTPLPNYTIKVPTYLPSKIKSFYLSFYNLKSSSIENLDQWITKNIVMGEQAFLNAVNFDQDLSKWDMSNLKNSKQFFKDAKKLTYLEKIAEAWKISKDKLTK
ncbi:Hypothetical protein, predicted lipoprotein [Metamycoplasma auris 15026]|uniref:Lipoprotein n=1 Tax=Metamycoplasma auris 15026 TaxID=1188233 RepID=N9TR46_9BACT|nr:variable surface lipoprotein [Metamycoplasma auris]ENY68624.1 Hypothetical protein, predicted lipoprotein [Metamycoplasma auris 15026]